MTEMSTEWESESEIKKPVKDVPVVQDQGLFKHDTGDTYDGYFEAKKKDRSVKMHGIEYVRFILNNILILTKPTERASHLMAIFTDNTMRW